MTSGLRSDEFAASFTRRGVTVPRAPILRILPLLEDVDLHAATLRIIDSPPHAATLRIIDSPPHAATSTSATSTSRSSAPPGPPTGGVTGHA